MRNSGYFGTDVRVHTPPGTRRCICTSRNTEFNPKETYNVPKTDLAND